MIEIYAQGNENYTKNGDVVLTPTVCELRPVINDSWELTLSHPIDEEGRWKYIVAGAVVKAPSMNGSQLFSLYQVSKSDAGVVAIGEPIFMRARDEVFVRDTRPTNATGQAALTTILSSNSKYSATSNITQKHTAYYILKNAMECIAGEDENSFLNLWGGEILFNNFNIEVRTQIGQDNGVQLLYGKNIPVDGMSETVDFSDVVTRIVPKGFNGRTLSGTSPWVNSPLINSYPTVMTRVIEYPHIKYKPDMQGEAEEGDIVCTTLTAFYTALRNAANEEFTSGIDKPKVTIECDMVLLQNTQEYSDYVRLEKVTLGDTIHCKHSKLGVVTDARVVALTYDCIRDATIEVTIGAVATNFMSRVASSVNATEKALTKSGNVNAERIEGFINGAMAQLHVQSTVAEPQDVRAILFEDLNPSSPTYGALAIGTQGLQISKTRNDAGTEWIWTTAATSEGIIANTIIAQDQLIVAKHFFADVNGVHVTEDEYDYTTGNNIFIDGDSIDIRDGTTTRATFGATSVIGQTGTNQHNVLISNNGMYVRKGTDLYSVFGFNNGEPYTRIGNIGDGQKNIVITDGNILMRNGSESRLILSVDGTTPYVRVGQSATGQKNVIITDGAVNLRDGQDTHLQLATDTTSTYIRVGQTGTNQNNIIIRPTGVYQRTGTTANASFTYDSANSTPQILLGRTGTDQRNVLIKNGSIDLRTGTTSEFFVSSDSTSAFVRIGQSDGMRTVIRPTAMTMGKVETGTRNLLITDSALSFRTGSTVDASFGYNSTSDTPIITLGRANQYRTIIENSSFTIKDPTNYNAVRIDGDYQDGGLFSLYDIAKISNKVQGAAGSTNTRSSLSLTELYSLEAIQQYNSSAGAIIDGGVLETFGKSGLSINPSKTEKYFNGTSSRTIVTDYTNGIKIRDNGTDKLQLGWGATIRTANGGVIYGKDSGGTDRSALVTNSSADYVILGQGNYNASQGGTTIYGHNLQLTSHGSIRLRIASADGLDNKDWVINSSGNMTIPANATIDGLDPSVVGLATSDTIANRSIASGTSWVNLTSITLPSGTYLFNVEVDFSTNATGRRQLCLSATSGGGELNWLCRDIRAAVNGNYTSTRIVYTATFSSFTTLYVNAMQNSGNSLTVGGRWQYTVLR